MRPETCPARLFFQVMESNDYEEVGGDEAWTVLYKYWVDHIGISASYELYLEAKTEELKHLSAWKVDGVQSSKTHAKLAELKADSLMKFIQDQPKADYSKMMASVSKYTGFPVFNEPISDFIGYYKLAEDESKQLKDG